MGSSTIFWGILFGSIGTGFFIYGKKQQKIVPLLCGVALMIFPYFVEGALLTVLVGIALIAVSWFVRV